MGGFHKDALPHDFELAEYTIESMLGHGGFGITYLARDRHLDTRVAIKEYFPADLAVREDIAAVAPKPTPKATRDYHLGLKNFIKEARALAHFKHPNIVRVLRYLEAYGTAYMVMEYSQGGGLADQLRQQGSKLTESALLRIFLPILNGVRAVHEADMLHLDIKPENIYLRSDGSPMLIDFGSTRQAISQTMPEKFMVTHGYAPIEQYPDKGKQGPWTDVYALGASMYRCVSGKRPINALERYQATLHYQTDPLTPAAVIGKNDYSPQLLGCIDWALQVHARDRPQSARAFQDRLLGSSTSTQTAVSRTVTVRTATSTSAPPPATPDRRKKRQPVQRSNRGLVAMLLLTIIGAGVYFWLEHDAGSRSAPPVLPAPTLPAAAPAVPVKEEATTVPATASATPAPTLRQSLRGHTDTVLSLAFSPDSKRIVSAAADGTIRLWDSANGKSLKILRRHQGAVSAVAYSANGRWLAAAGHDGVVRLWEEKSGAIRNEWRGPGNAILALAFSPDSRWLAAAGRDRVVQLWSVTDGRLAHTYPGHHGDVLGLAFSPDGNTLASAGADRSVRLWNVGGARDPAGLSIYRTAVQALAFSPDGRWLASGTEDHTVRLAETGAGTQIQTFVTALASVHALTYSPDGTQLVIGTADKKIQILDAVKGTLLHTLEGHQDKVLAVAMSPDGRSLASAGRDQVIQVWDR